MERIRSPDAAARASQPASALAGGLASPSEAPPAVARATTAGGTGVGRACAALLAAAAVCGCASEHVTPPAVSLPSAYEAPTGPSLAAGELDHWWTLYRDPQLASLVEEALARAPDARTAVARLREARAARSSALSQYDLVGDLNGTGTDTFNRTLAGTALDIPGLATSGESRSGSADLDVSWELDLFGRRGAARRSADADLVAARFEEATSRASLAANVADSLFAARGLAVQLDDAKESARVAESLADAARARFQAGIASSSDADQAAADARRAQAAAADLVGQLQAARRSLLVLSGRGTDPSASLVIQPDLAPPVAAPAVLPGALLVRRPDVREARERLFSAMGKLKLDELALLPTVQLSAALTGSRLEQTGYSATTAAWSVGSAVTAPVFSRPRLIAEVHAQGARAEQAVVAYEQAVQTAYGEAENALAQSAQDKARVAALEQGEAEARRAFEAARGRYAAGVDSASDALLTEQSWRSARANLTIARIAALRRSVTLFKALGGGWSPGDA